MCRFEKHSFLHEGIKLLVVPLIAKLGRPGGLTVHHPDVTPAGRLAAEAVADTIVGTVLFPSRARGNICRGCLSVWPFVVAVDVFTAAVSMVVPRTEGLFGAGWGGLAAPGGTFGAEWTISLDLQS